MTARLLAPAKMLISLSKIQQQNPHPIRRKIWHMRKQIQWSLTRTPKIECNRTAPGSSRTDVVRTTRLVPIWPAEHRTTPYALTPRRRRLFSSHRFSAADYHSMCFIGYYHLHGPRSPRTQGGHACTLPGHKGTQCLVSDPLLKSLGIPAAAQR